MGLHSLVLHSLRLPRAATSTKARRGRASREGTRCASATGVPSEAVRARPAWMLRGKRLNPFARSTLGRIRTPGLRYRKPTLCPTELRAHVLSLYGRNRTGRKFRLAARAGEGRQRRVSSYPAASYPSAPRFSRTGASSPSERGSAVPAGVRGGERPHRRGRRETLDGKR